MFLQMRKEFAEIGFDDLSTRAELAADFRCDLCLRTSLPQKFKHPRADQVQPEHLSLADVEDDGPVLVVG
jgi:hypothetical protein